VEELLAAERARGRVTISIDPNIRPPLAASRADEVARVERQIRLAHIVKASEEDTGWLYPGLGPESVARHWQRLGPDLVVITLGTRGAFALAPDGTEARQPARAVQVADTVGAGDAFSAGLLDALWRRGLLGAAGGLPPAPDGPRRGRRSWRGGPGRCSRRGRRPGARPDHRSGRYRSPGLGGPGRGPDLRAARR
jgi:sugar/nucleoside kinase (ribokinase family)